MPETKLEPRAGQPQQQSHGLALRDRRHLAVTGVSRVISCDESAAVLETPLGNLTVGGQELQIGELSTQSGQVQISGKIEYLQYAENRQALFNSAMDKHPSGLLCFSFIYPAEPDNGAVMTFLPAKETMPGLSQAETDALYTGIFLRLRHTYGDLLDEEEAETLEKDAILACEIKSALYQSILQLSPQDAAGVLRYIWGRDGIF